MPIRSLAELYLVYLVLEVGAHFSLKVTIKASLRGEKILKILIFRLLFQSKNGGVQTKRLTCLP